MRHLDWSSMSIQSSLPSDAAQQVDADIDRHHVKHTSTLAIQRPQHSLPNPYNESTGTCTVAVEHITKSVTHH